MPKNWKSIPYGKPLRYQAYRVVDEYGRDCPYWAEGELWIGGFGVAKGYRGDSALTGQKFITDQYGRWYRTGDLGRIWDDETIEFLGRKDHQVKIRGHRIELGEIEHAIQEFPGVAHAVVDTVSDGHGNKTLAAYIGAPIQEDSKVTTYLYGTDIFGGGWKELKDDVSNWQMQQERKTAYKNFLAYADQRCVQLMLETLIELGIFVSEKEVLSQKEIFEKGSITETQKNTVARWLEILKKEGILREEDGRLSRTGKEVAVPEKAGDTETYFNKLKPYLKHMVTGNEVPLDVFYQKEPALAPNMLLRRIPGCEETVERLVQGLRLLAEERRKEPLQIIEIGTRDTAITRQFLNALEDVSVAYTYADSSKYFLQEAEKELVGYERVEFEMLNLEEGMDKQQMSLHSYDVVISVNALHRNIDAADAVKKVAELLKPNGILLMTDLVVRTYLQELTAAFLENGFADIRDKRKEAGLVTPDCLLWRECLSEAGLGEDCAVTERYTTLTKEKFVYVEEEKNRIYLTGDNGRYVENGDIEFLGRLDNQVKINGHRIEIAEIENAIRGMCAKWKNFTCSEKKSAESSNKNFEIIYIAICYRRNSRNYTREPKFLVAPVGSRISVATQGRLRYETYITDIKQVGMDQWTWRLTYKVFCGKNIVSTVDSLMSWNYQSVEKILNQLTKMHFRTAKLSETLLLAIKAR